MSRTTPESAACADPGARWTGPHGGLPPFDVATPADIEAEITAAAAAKRARIEQIATDARAPSFSNTVLELEASGRALSDAEALMGAFAATALLGEMAEVRARCAAEIARLEIEVAGNAALFARIDAVFAGRDALASLDGRLTEIIHARFVRKGARLEGAARERLAEIDAEIARLFTRFSQNVNADERELAVLITDADELDGLPADQIAAAKREAEARGQPDGHAIANTRVAVWGALQTARNRDLRRRVRDMWITRGGNDGANDNRPVMAELVKLRGEKARLFGYPSFAHMQTAERMAKTPEAAMAQLRRVWDAVLPRTKRDLAEMERLAAADGIAGPLEPWDTRYYAEALRRDRYAIDAEAVREHLELGNVLAMLKDVALRLHGIEFVPLPDAPRISPEIDVFELRRGGETFAVLWLDLFRRDGKMQGAFQQQIRAAESFEGRVVPLSLMSASLERGVDGVTLMPWELANVLFHEFGHALHMVMSRAPYPSLGPMETAWDAIELPSQLHERWLLDPDLLRRFARHYQTGEPMRDAMIAGLEAALLHDRVTSLTLQYLAPAIVDLELYLAADGREVDPIEIEQRVYAELDMPRAIDPIMRVPHQYHSATDVYAAGVYSYLWADVMVADVLEAFTHSPGGLYDAEVSQRWRDHILSAGAMTDSAEAFRAFRGRDPDPQAVLRRFALA